MAILLLYGGTVGLAGAVEQIDTADASSGNQEHNARLRALSREAMKTYNLKSLIVRVTVEGKDFYTDAMGESMNGVPAAPDMHFRNGAMAFTYMSTMLLELVDERPQVVSLDDKLTKYLPDLPESGKISLKNLANMTSGYADYVYQEVVLKGLSLDPFRQWTSEELIQIGISKPMQFEPATNWGYSHTNYVILGRVLERITGMPLAAAMRKYIFLRSKTRATDHTGTGVNGHKKQPYRFFSRTDIIVYLTALLVR